MAYTFGSEFYLEIARGNVSGMSVVHNFGRHPSVGTTLEPIAIGGVYSMATSAVTLEAVSSSGQDSSGGAGARTLFLQGLNASFTEVSETITMNGVSATSATSNSYIRLYRAYVATTGTYATASKLNNNGVITIRQSGAGSTWAQINNTGTGFGLGQSEIACYTIPAGKTGYITSIDITVESSKTVNLFLFQRPDADDVIAPFSSMRLRQNFTAMEQRNRYRPVIPVGSFPEKTDIVFMGKTSAGTTSVSIDFEILLIDN